MSSSTTLVSRLQNQLQYCKQELAQVTEDVRRLTERKRELTQKVRDIHNEEGFAGLQFEGDDFPWSKKAEEKLRSVFKIQSFRSHQKVAINATMSGVDLLLIMPTGGGKSLCFQLPAVLSKGLTLVVSPLLSLMQDQLQGLQELGIRTKVFSGSTDKEESKALLREVGDPESGLRLLYVTPEKLAKSKTLMNQLEKANKVGKFVRLVIDEVHCCSQWGHDFRPDYKFLGVMKSQFPSTPIIGLTATATANVILDIQKILGIEGSLVLRDSFFRPNLRYSVLDASAQIDKVDKIAELINTKFKNHCGIVYCLTVKDCEEVAKKLRNEHGVRCKYYHAQMEIESRVRVQHSWSNNDIQVIVATVAFGMGINKLDVRFVIHYSMSKSIENYYQEAGRAGRDGAQAECILFFTFSDIFRASCIMMTERNGVENVYRMARYAVEQNMCRKQFVADHFGDKCEAIQDGCRMCDNCDMKFHPGARKELVVDDAEDLLKGVVKILDNAEGQEIRMTSLKLMDSWFQKGPVKLRLQGVDVPAYDRALCEKLVAKFLLEGYLKEDFHFTPYSTISYLVSGARTSSLFRKDKGDTNREKLMYKFYVEEGSGGNGRFSKNANNTNRKKPVKRKSTVVDNSSESDDECYVVSD